MAATCSSAALTQLCLPVNSLTIVRSDPLPLVKSALRHFFREGQTDNKVRTVVYPVTNISRAGFGRAVLMKQRLRAKNASLPRTHSQAGIPEMQEGDVTGVSVQQALVFVLFFWQGTTRAVPKHTYENTKRGDRMPVNNFKCVSPPV